MFSESFPDSDQNDLKRLLYSGTVMRVSLKCYIYTVNIEILYGCKYSLGFFFTISGSSTWKIGV